MNTELTNKAANTIRVLAASMVEKAKSGHPGGAMGGADFVNVLYSQFLITDPDNPTWFARDRFFLDPGHMSPMLYSVLALTGKFTMAELQQFHRDTPNSIPNEASKTLQARWDKVTPWPWAAPLPSVSFRPASATLWLTRPMPSSATAVFRRKSRREPAASPDSSA